LNLSPQRDKSIDRLSERLNNLYPNHNTNGLEVTHWKGKRIVSVAEWENISGLDEIRARDREIESRPEVKEFLKINLDYPEDAWEELASIRWEIRKEALDYFPDGIIHGALSGGYSCPEASVYKKDPKSAPAEGDEFNVWVSDYKDFLKSKGIEESDYTIPSNRSPLA
jgi:hypothetical protein